MKIELSEKLWDRSVILRIIVGLLAIAAVFIICVMVIAPFVPAILLALILTLATWPAFTYIEKRLNHKTTLAATLMTIILIFIFVAPLLFIGSTLMDSFRGLMGTLTSTLGQRPTSMPDWLHSLPIIGGHVDQFWSDYIENKERIPMLLQEHSGTITQKLLAVAASIGKGIVDISLAVLISFFMFRHGVGAGERVLSLIENFGGAKAVHLLHVSKGTLIAVIYGVVGTAIAQGALAAFGFWLAGVPGPALLGLLVFILSFIPGGPPLIWIPATIWLFGEDMVGAGIFLGLWSLIIVSGADNVLRPYFISLGSNLPLLLVLMGVIGGILAFGFIGLFVGPTILAVAYNIMLEWSHAQEEKIIPADNSK
jgi:predicted PurR-regulated permease PerM